MTEENSRRGLANRRAGKRAQHRAVVWLRESGGCPAAEVTTAPHRGDMVTGVGDVNLEVTIESWQAIGEKADQAASDARALGYDRWCIWKPRRGVGDMGRAWAVTEFGQLWAMVREIRQLRRLAAALALVAEPAKVQAALDQLAALDPAAAQLLNGFTADKLLHTLAGTDDQ